MPSAAPSTQVRAISSDTDTKCARRLIVDTDLGLDDLVALALLRVQQSMPQTPQYTQFRLAGVTITSGVSDATADNAALLRRILPPETPVYVSAETPPWQDKEKPEWWPRTANRVAEFLSSLPPAQTPTQSDSDKSAEQFIAENMDDPTVDFLCMAPLTTIAKAVQLWSKQQPGGSPTANFYIMGGIRCDSHVTKRGKSTAPWHYHDVVGARSADAVADQKDQLGEFNFALDIGAARLVLSNVSVRILPVEACTLVPTSLRPSPSESTDSLSSILSSPPTIQRSGDASELCNSRSTLFQLLTQFGTAETQWDSICAAIYCNAFGTACIGDEEKRSALEQIDSRKTWVNCPTLVAGWMNLQEG
ncbi:hypothetical protein ACHAXT_007871 [Thalassiosira profunda]